MDGIIGMPSVCETHHSYLDSEKGRWEGSWRFILAIRADWRSAVSLAVVIVGVG